MKDNIILLLQVVERLIKDREVSKRKLSMDAYELGDLIFVATGSLEIEIFTRMSMVDIYTAWMRKNYPSKTSCYEYPPEGCLEERMEILEKFRGYLIGEINED